MLTHGMPIDLPRWIAGHHAAEDTAVLEARHASLRAHPAPLFNTVHDRVLEKLFAAE
jgi:hypothetical protein